jgi:hypothetical protein
MARIWYHFFILKIGNFAVGICKNYYLLENFMYLNQSFADLEGKNDPLFLDKF